MKLSLGKKIIGGFIICSLVLLMVAVISLRNSEKFVASSQWVNHTHEVLHQLDQTLISAVNAEPGERGFIITGDPNYLEPYNNAASELSQHITRDPIQQRRNSPVVSIRATGKDGRWTFSITTPKQ